MPFNGSGTFSRPVSPYVFDTVISETDVNTEMAGIATGLSNCVTKDGQTTVTANLPMSGFRHTGVGAASARTQYGTVTQIQDGDYLEVGSVAGTDTITGSVSPAITAYAEGQVFFFKAADTNTGATTINLNSVGAKAIQKLGAALAAGDITAGDAVAIYYDGTQFQMLTPARTPVLANKTGVDADIVSGTAGTDGNLAQWNTDGDLVDGPDFLDEDNMASDSATAVASQQSIKAYVDTEIAANVAAIGTPVTTNSGTSHTWTGIPSSATEVTLSLASVSTDGTSALRFRIGPSGGVATTGYAGTSTQISGASVGGTENFSAGVDANATAAGAAWGGWVRFTLIDATNFIYAIVFQISRSDTTILNFGSGFITLTGLAERITLTTVGGTDLFDAGTANVRYS